jgi:hypothetical protein
VELERLEVTEAWKTLGVKTAPTGDTTAQFEHMPEASQKWAAQIKTNNLRQMDAWLAVHHLEESGVSPYMYDID